MTEIITDKFKKKKGKNVFCYPDNVTIILSEILYTLRVYSTGQRVHCVHYYDFMNDIIVGEKRSIS